MNFKCKICNNSINNTLHEAREMMFGFRDKFDYIECSNCKCLQIKQIPNNIEKYYPKEYYSFSPVIFRKTSWKLNVKRIVDRFRINLYLKGVPFVKPFGLPYWTRFLRFKNFNITTNSKILDIGGGSGSLIYQLYYIGFSNLTSIDPYISPPEKNIPQVRVLKKHIKEVQEKFDFIMLNHSFEHMEEPFEEIRSLSKLLKEDGIIMIRIPVVPSYSWETYKTNWIQLDAPRHFFIHSIDSMSILCKSTGLKIHSIEFDSSDFQFFGSEIYSKDIPLNECGLRNDLGITKNDFKEFRRKAKILNKAKNGDQACFFIKKDKNTFG